MSRLSHETRKENIDQSINIGDIKPGDIIVTESVLCEFILPKARRLFERYSAGSFRELQSLYPIVNLGQKLFSWSARGHSSVCHAGVCIGTISGEPYITDLHVRIQDINAKDFYIPVTWYVFRPNSIDSDDFQQARLNLAKNLTPDEKKIGKNIKAVILKEDQLLILIVTLKNSIFTYLEE